MKINYFQGTKWLVRKELTLNGSSNAATMTVSVLFHPVRCVQKITNSSRKNSDNQVVAEDELKKNLPWMQQAVITLYA